MEQLVFLMLERWGRKGEVYRERVGEEGGGRERVGEGGRGLT